MGRTRIYIIHELQDKSFTRSQIGKAIKMSTADLLPAADRKAEDLLLPDPDPASSEAEATPASGSEQASSRATRQTGWTTAGRSSSAGQSTPPLGAPHLQTTQTTITYP